VLADLLDVFDELKAILGATLLERNLAVPMVTEDERLGGVLGVSGQPGDH